MSNSLYLKGPLYYRETDQDIFWGRDEEIDDIYYLVSNSDFSICYAKSGEGKSSLINAGLIPLLRERGFLPICIRFTSNNYKEKKPNFDNIIVTDIYAARENNDYGISSMDLVNKSKSLGKDATYISSFDDIVKYVRERACPNDIILTVGAGTVTEIGRKILLK